MIDLKDITSKNNKEVKNTSVNGWTFYRYGNTVVYKHNKVLSGVVSGHDYNNQGYIPEGYRPVIDIMAHGDRIVGVSIVGAFYADLKKDGSTHFYSPETYSGEQSYVMCGLYITTDEFPST